MVAATNQLLIPQLDLQATDVHPPSRDLAYLVYNPKSPPDVSAVSVRCARCTRPGKYDVTDTVGNRALGTCTVPDNDDGAAGCKIDVKLASDTAAVVMFRRRRVRDELPGARVSELGGNLK